MLGRRWRAEFAGYPPEALVQAGLYGGTSGWNLAWNVAQNVFHQRNVVGS
jgi:hypothetical protein